MTVPSLETTRPEPARRRLVCALGSLATLSAVIMDRLLGLEDERCGAAQHGGHAFAPTGKDTWERRKDTPRRLCFCSSWRLGGLAGLSLLFFVARILCHSARVYPS